MIRFDNLRFWVANSGVEVSLREEVVGRLNPTESLALLTYLEEHRGEFERAIEQAAEPVLGSKRWEAQQLDKEFRNMPE